LKKRQTCGFLNIDEIKVGGIKLSLFSIFEGSSNIVAMRFLPLLLVLGMTSVMTPVNSVAADAALRHVVSFKFKKEAKADDIAKIEKAFVALKSKISEIQSLEWGTDVGPEGLSKGFTHTWILQFKDVAALKTYIDHPDHVAFVKLLKPSLDDVFVMDFHPKP
jgi:hypothetical protein